MLEITLRSPDSASREWASHLDWRSITVVVLPAPECIQDSQMACRKELLAVSPELLISWVRVGPQSDKSNTFQVLWDRTSEACVVNTGLDTKKRGESMGGGKGPGFGSRLCRVYSCMGNAESCNWLLPL